MCCNSEVIDPRTARRARAPWVSGCGGHFGRAFELGAVRVGAEHLAVVPPGRTRRPGVRRPINRRQRQRGLDRARAARHRALAPSIAIVLRLRLRIGPRRLGVARAVRRGHQSATRWRRRRFTESGRSHRIDRRSARAHPWRKDPQRLAKQRCADDDIDDRGPSHCKMISTRRPIRCTRRVRRTLERSTRPQIPNASQTQSATLVLSFR